MAIVKRKRDSVPVRHSRAMADVQGSAARRFRTVRHGRRPVRPRPFPHRAARTSRSATLARRPVTSSDSWSAARLRGLPPDTPRRHTTKAKRPPSVGSHLESRRRSATSRLASTTASFGSTPHIGCLRVARRNQGMIAGVQVSGGSGRPESTSSRCGSLPIHCSQSTSGVRRTLPFYPVTFHMAATALSAGSKTKREHSVLLLC